MLKTKTRKELEQTKQELENTNLKLSGLMRYLNVEYRGGKRNYIAKSFDRSKRRKRV